MLVAVSEWVWELLFERFKYLVGHDAGIALL